MASPPIKLRLPKFKLVWSLVPGFLSPVTINPKRKGTQMENTTTQKKTAFKRKDIQQEVTDTIIKQLEAGVVPWHKPWSGENHSLLALPKNATTDKKYRGINILLLWSSYLTNNFTTDEYATFKQWNDKKEQVRKNEKGSLIVYYDTMEKEVDGKIEEIPFLKASYVFNRCQLVGYVPETKPKTEKALWETIEPVEEFIANTKLVIEHSATSGACYVPLFDKIIMPDQDRFENSEQCTATEGYYATLFHEAIHATGHESRVNRNLSTKFGERQYAVEELVAEFGASFLCAEFEIPTLIKGNHASYIDHWLNVLKENKQFVFAAAKEASKAVEYLQNLQP